MAPRIIKDTANGDVEVKRMYLPGVKIEDDCPKCGKLWEWNGDSNYISYPTMGGKINLYGWCDACGANWDVQVTLKVGVSISL